MKPSEEIERYIRFYNNSKKDSDKLLYELSFLIPFDELNKRFIDREELKDKIKEIKWDRDTTQDFDEVINKILELIK